MAFVLALLTVLPACLEEPFLRNDGPTEAGGAVVSLISQSCDANSNGIEVSATLGTDEGWLMSDDDDDPVLELAMRVQVENHGESPITFDPRSLRLVVGKINTKPTDSAEAREIAPGTSAKLWVRFHKRGGLACNLPMQLMMENSVQVSGRPVTLRPVSFVATSSEE